MFNRRGREPNKTRPRNSMKIVINKCFGGFSISKECAEFMAGKGCPVATAALKKGDRYGYGYTEEYPDGYERTSPYLIEAVEALGEKADGEYAKLEVVEIPDGIEWELEYYDGLEHIAESHRTWR